MGPHSRQLLRRLLVDPSDLDDGRFPFGTARDLAVGHVLARVARVTYVGELGFELFVPPDSLCSLYEALHAAARHFMLMGHGLYINELMAKKFSLLGCVALLIAVIWQAITC